MSRGMETPGHGDRPIRVLCVDADPEAVASTARLLERRHGQFETATATGAREATDRLAEGTPDCVVCGHRTPDVDGLALLSAVRERDPDLPFILLAGDDERLASEAIAAGVTDYVRTRPGSDRPDALADRVRLAVARRETHASPVEAGTEPPFEAVFDALPLGVVVRRASGEAVAVNDRAGELVATGAGDASGERGRLALDDLPLEAVVETGVPVEGRVLGTSAVGTDRWFRVSAAPLEGSAEVSHVGYVVEEVTETRRRASEREDRLDRITDGFTTVDEDWRITYANQRALEVLGYERDELVGEVLWEAFPEAVGTEFQETYTRAMETNEPGAVEAYYEPSETWFEARVYPSETGLSLYFRDVTDRRERDAYLERNESIVRTVQDGVYTLDADGRFTFVNDAFVELTAHDREALLGQHISAILPDEAVAAGQRRIEDLLAGDRDAVSFEMTTPDATGDPNTYDVKVTLLPTEDGEFRGSVGVVRDVSELKARERELERYEHIVDSAPDVIYALDTDRRFTVVNEFFAQLVGRPRSDLLGEHFRLLATEGLVDQANLEAGLDAMDRVLEGEADQVRFETEFAVGEFEGIAENILTRLETDGELYGVVNIVRDVTERKARERELERQNARLEEFASIVSHDLRNPLTVASGSLDLARDSGDPADFDRVEAAHARMEELIEDLLTMARNGQRVERTRPVDLGAMCERAWATVESSEATLSVTAEDYLVDADPERLRSLLENLFSNAVEHAGADAAVEVGTLAREEGFYVADDGPGVREADRETVFERGYSTSQGGTGFGLAIVRSIAEAHGWTATMTESAEGGARIEVRTAAGPEQLSPPS